MPGVLGYGRGLVIHLTGIFVILAGGLFLAPAAHSHEARIISDAGDYVGGGNEYLLGEFSLITTGPSGNGIFIEWQTGNDIWWFKFSGSDGAALAAGSYQNAERHQFQSPGRPGLDISGLGRGCNALTGRFVIYDIALAGDGSVERLAVDAVQYCEGSARALRVFLRYGPTTVPLDVPATIARAGVDQIVLPGTNVTLDGSSSVAASGNLVAYQWTQVAGPAVTLGNAVTTQFTAPTPVAEWVVMTFELTVTDGANVTSVDSVTVVVSEQTQPRNELAIDSPPGETLGQGRSFRTNFLATQLQTDRNFFNGVHLTISDLLPAGSNGPVFDLQLHGHNSEELAVGNYSLAYRYPFSGPTGKAGMDATLGIGCIHLVGYFTVHDVAYDSGGHLERLAVDFTEYCLDESGSGPLTGSVRINSTVPIRSRAPTASAGDDLLVMPAQVVQLSSATSIAGLTPIVGYRWRQLSGPGVSIPTPTASAFNLVVPAVPPLGATLEFELRVTNAAGFQSFDRVKVRIQGVAERKSFAYIEVDPRGLDFVFQFDSIFLDRNTGEFHIQTFGAGTGNEEILLTFDDIGFFHFDLRPPAGTNLQTGVYPDIDRFSDATLRLDASMDGRGSNRTVGSAVIHAIERDTDGNVTSLAMDFVIQGDLGPPVHGVIRYNTTVPFIAPDAQASAGPDQQVGGGDETRLDAGLSYPGDSGIVSFEWTQVGGPAVQLTDPNSTTTFFTAPDQGGILEFELTITTADGQVLTSRVRIVVDPGGVPRTVLLIEGEGPEPLTYGQTFLMPMEFSDTILRPASDGHLWVYLPGLTHASDLHFWAPFDVNLAVGAYEGARRYQFDMNHQVRNWPGMTINVDGRMCLLARGRFVIRELVRDGTGTITSLAVDFQQTCDPTGHYLRGQFRINSAVPLRGRQPIAAAGQDLVVRAGRTFDLDGGASASWLDPNATFEWTQLSGPSVQIAQSNRAKTTAIAPMMPVGAATAEFELAVTDRYGVSRDRMSVALVGDDAPFTEISAALVVSPNGQVLRRYRQDANNAYQRLARDVLPGYFLRSFSEDFFSVAIGLPTTTTLVPTGIFRLHEGFADVGTLRFAAGGFSDGCYASEGVVRIVDVAYTSGDLSAFAADFDIRCGSGASYAGVVRWNSATPIETDRVFVSAGGDRAASENTNVRLDGTTSLIVGGGIDSFRWTQLAGPPVTLTDRGTGVVSFVAPAVDQTTQLRFEMRIAGGQSASGADDVIVDVTDNGITGFPAGFRATRGSTGAAIAFRSSALLTAISAVTPERRGTAVPDQSPYGAFDLEYQVNPGGSITLEVGVLDPLATGADWIQYTYNQGWISFSPPRSFSADRRVISFSVSDGGAEDIDGAVNGFVRISGGVGVPQVQPPPPPPPPPPPGGGGGGGAMPPWALLLLAPLVMWRRPRQLAR